jgi:hypothetical protein
VHTDFGGPLITYNSFVKLSAAGFDLTAHPDFSSTGSPIQFGYASGSGTAGTSSGLTMSGVDNWSVDIIGVPEPSPLTLLGIVTLGLIGYA